MIEDKYLHFISGDAYHRGSKYGLVAGIILGCIIGFLAGWGWGVRSNILPLIDRSQEWMIEEMRENKLRYNERLIDKREPKR